MDDLPAQLRRALVSADYTYDRVADVLGPMAHAALGRNETTPGLARTTGGTALDTLIRLFLLQTPVPLPKAEAALPGLIDAMSAQGLVEQSVGQVAARLDIRPYATDNGPDGDSEFWVISDLTPGLDGGPQRVGGSHVLGISSASISLSQLTLRHQVDSALDLGTGCGVQALHLAEHAEHVVATDVNPRALGAARFNASLNGVSTGSAGGGVIEVRDGSYFEPVADETFDLIATNPPFVISPGTGERLVYRDSGLPGDRVVEDIVRAAPTHLNEGGWCQVLANWVIERGVAWEERLGDWFTGDCDVLVVQRERIDPASYVELWIKDAGLHGATDYLDRYDTWLSWFADQGIEEIGFGWINLRKRPADADPAAATITFLDWRFDVEQPIAPAIAAWGRAVDTLRAGIDETSRLRCPSDVRQEAVGPVGAEDPEVIVLRQQRGFRRARQVDTVVAGLVGACDGDLTIGQILDALAQLLEEPAPTLHETYLPVVRELVAEGFLLPHPDPEPQ